MKRILLALAVVVIAISISRTAQPGTVLTPRETETPLCAVGTAVEQDNCVLDPNDCSRGIDESNQEACDQGGAK